MEKSERRKAQKLECVNVSLYPENDEIPIVKDVSLSLSQGELLVIIGPSGCGKSTMLNILAGLTTPTSGWMALNGERQSGVPSNVGLIFQEYALFPWLTVADNVAFALKNSELSRRERYEKTISVLERVGLFPHRSKYPHQLSGGMKQRVAIARSLVYNAEFLLMDEPFSALDHQTRYMMQTFMLEIWRQFHPGIAFVTHYIEEAIILADRIVLMSTCPGFIVEEIEVGLPRPRNALSTEFNEYRAHIAIHLEREAEKQFLLQRGGANTPDISNAE